MREDSIGALHKRPHKVTMDSKHGLQVEHNLLARDSIPTVAN
jgi:hypothetical protein